MSSETRRCPECSGSLEVHSVTEVNGAGVHREYWYQCAKCGETFDGYDGRLQAAHE